MTELILPIEYRSKLDYTETQIAIKEIKDNFQKRLAKKLNLIRVSAPLLLEAGTGVNDNLNGTERIASFEVGSGKSVEIPNSLAKWKRQELGRHEYRIGSGLYTDMNGARLDDRLDNLHSHYVDQWDWERAISTDQRTLKYLKEIVRKVYSAIRSTAHEVYAKHPQLRKDLPASIAFVHSEDLQREYPTLTAREREDMAAKEHGSIFVVGIGGELPDGSIHDGRAPDYDDWTTPALDGKKGLNGDIVVWNPLLGRSYELSSMGIRVDKDAMLSQLEIRASQADRSGLHDLAESYRARVNQEWHRSLIAGEFPLSIGGGIGQSRLCMYLLDKAHIGEVQVGVWPDDMRQRCHEAGIELL